MEAKFKEKDEVDYNKRKAVVIDIMVNLFDIRYKIKYTSLGTDYIIIVRDIEIKKINL